MAQGENEKTLRLASIAEARTAIARAAYLNGVSPSELEPLLRYEVESKLNNPKNRKVWDVEVKMAQGHDKA